MLAVLAWAGETFGAGASTCLLFLVWAGETFRAGATLACHPITIAASFSHQPVFVSCLTGGLLFASEGFQRDLFKKSGKELSSYLESKLVTSVDERNGARSMFMNRCAAPRDTNSRTHTHTHRPRRPRVNT